VQTSQPQQLQSLPPRRTTATLKSTTVPDRSQAYVHAPQHGAAASCRHRQRRASRTYGFSRLLSAPSLPSTPDVTVSLLRRTAPVAGGELGCGTCPSTSSILNRDVRIRLCVRACPSASDALDTETCELCREFPPLPEPELVFRKRERERKALLIHMREVELPLREPSNDALGLG